MNKNILAAVLMAALTLLAACTDGEDDDGGGGGGSGGGPREIEISRAGVIADGGTDSLGSVAFGVNSNLTYTIDNVGGSSLALTGGTPVTATVVGNCTATVITQPTTPVAGGGSTTFTIQLNVTAAGAFSFTVDVANDDADESPYNFTVDGTGAAVPEINVQRSAVNVPDGSTDNVGSAFTAGVQTTLTWTIQNTGLATLGLTGAPNIQTTGLTNCALSVTQPSTSTIAASGSTTFMIGITPSAATFGFNIEIDNDDSDENPYDIIVSGTATVPSPEINIQRSAVNIADGATDAVGSAFSIGVQTTLTWTIQNTGTATLNLTGTPDVATNSATNCTLSVTQPSTSAIAAAGSTTFMIGITPTGASFSFNIEIDNDDSNEDPYDIIVSGTATALSPEINLQRSAVNIADGATDAVGSAFVIGVQTTLTWTIQNTGTATLNLTGTPDVQTSGLSNCTLSVTQPATSAIAASGSTTFMIGITATGASFGFNIAIANDDSNENPYDIIVSGTASVATGPEIVVFTEFAEITSGTPAFWKSVAPTSFTAFPIMVRNTGNANLNISATSIQSDNNCTVTVRENPPAAIVPNDTAAFTVLVDAPSSGNFDFTVRISNDDANESTFDVFIQASTVPSTHALISTFTTNGLELISATYPGAVTRVTMNNTMTTGAGGVGQFHHLGDRVLYTAGLVPGGPTDVWFRSTLNAGGTNTNISSTQTGATGSVGLIKFASQDNFVFTANTGANPTRAYSVTISGTAVGSATEINGAMPGGATGVSDVQVSPRKDQVALFGDLQTAGTNELFVVPFGGTSRTKVSANLTGGRVILAGSILWLKDASGILYITQTAGFNERELWLARIGSTAVKLNGTVPASNSGVNPTSVRAVASANRVFYQSFEGGSNELYSVYIPASGTPAAAVGLNGGTAPGSGVQVYSHNLDGTRVLFTSDSGPSSQVELYRTAYTVGTPATTKVLTVTNNANVQMETGAFSTKNTAWYIQSNAAGTLREIYSADVSTGFTAVKLLNPATFTGGSGPNVNSNEVLLHPDGVNILLLSDQGNGGLGTALFRATLGTVHSAVRLNAAGTHAGPPTLAGNRVYFERDNGATPQSCRGMLITDAQGTEVSVNADNTTQYFGHSEDRVFVATFAGAGEWRQSDAAGTNVLLSVSGQTPNEIKSGIETRP